MLTSEGASRLSVAKTWLAPEGRTHIYLLKLIRLLLTSPFKTLIISS